MTNVIRIKRRVTGAVGAPSSLRNAELAYNEPEDTLYYGKGDDGLGNALSVVAIAGVGKFLDLASAQTVTGAKTFTAAPSVPTPVANGDAANKGYVDSIVQGLNIKASVRVATSANVSLSAPGAAIDGVTMAAGDRVLLKAQTAAAENGIYAWTGSAAALTRATDADTAAELKSAFVFVEEGTSADNGFVMTTNAPFTLGTTSLTWTQFSGAGQIDAGAGLTKTGNQLNVGQGAGISVDADTVGLAGQALALHNLGTNGLVARTGAGSVAARSLATSGSGLGVANGDGVAGNPTISLSVSLSLVGGLTPAADQLAYYTGAGGAALAAFTAFGRSVVGAADAAAGRSALGLGSMATQNADNVAITGGTINNLTLDGGTF